MLAASGAFGYALEFAGHLDLNARGGFVVKGLSRKPIAGNPEPRIWEAERGMINSIGLQNIGVAAFMRDKLPKLAQLNTAVLANFFGYVSCPNTKHGGMFFSSDPGLWARCCARCAPWRCAR